jgi:hypothetical protein
MATIFPTSPAPQVNDEYQGYRYNGTSWDLIGNQYSPASYSASAPSNPRPGDIWIESDVDVPSISPETILTTSVASSTYQPIVSGVSNTEIGYLDGVTSSIQTQLGAKASLSGATFTGNITAPEVSASTKLVANTVGGDEGGEILLGKPATNTTLAGTGVTIDVFQNRLRIFEQGGNARGASLDITSLENGVASTIAVPGLNGVPFRMASGVAAHSSGTVTITYPSGRFTQTPQLIGTCDGGGSSQFNRFALVWSGNTSSSGVFIVRLTDSSIPTQAFNVHWIATQMTSGSASG